MQSGGRDLRHGVRLLLQARGFTVVALIALALGSGATTAIFSVVDAVLLRPLPFHNPERLLVIWEKNSTQNKSKLFVPAGNFSEWRRQSRTLEGMAALLDGRMNLTSGPDGPVEPEELRVERVSAGLFPLLGVEAAAGRTFADAEDRPGRANFALLSHRLWQRRFGAQRRILGGAVVLNQQSYTVVGILPAGFAVLDAAVDIWLPLGLEAGDPRLAATRTLTVIARMKPDVAPEQVRAEMDTVGASLESINPAVNRGSRPSLYPLSEELTGSVRRPLLVLLGAVACLLLMACANVASLLLARGAGRRKELAIRTAVGATRGMIVSQLVFENLVLALAGGAGGLLFAWGVIGAAGRLAAGSIPRISEARLDARLFLFTLAVSLFTGLLFGLLPAWQASRIEVNAALLDAGRGGTPGRASRRWRGVLVVAELAVAVVLLIGAGLLIRSFLRLRLANPGFDPGHVLTLRLPMAGNRNVARDRRAAFLQQLLVQIEALPGVRSAGASSALPLTGLGTGDTFMLEGRPVPPEQRPMALVRSVTPSYFRAMGIRLLAGREFTLADSVHSPSVALVSESLSRRYWPGKNSLGARLLFTNAAPVEIVGVVSDVKADRVAGEDWPTIYAPYAQRPSVTASLAVRTALPDPGAAASAVVRAVHELDPEQPVGDLRSMDAVVTGSLAGARFQTALLAAFAAVAFALSIVGVYGLMSYEVTERTREFGIRAALGAQPGNVFQLVLGQGARLALYGIAVGLAASLVLTRLMSSMLYGTGATDAATYAVISLLLGGVALAAAWVPSRKAMAMDPLTALRKE